MKRRGIAATIGAGAAGLALVPAAGAHHDPPDCTYGSNVLPDSVTVEYYRMLENCPGPRVTIETSAGQRLVVSHGRHHADPESSRSSEPRAPARKPSKRKPCRKSRGAKRSGKCR